MILFVYFINWIAFESHLNTPLLQLLAMLLPILLHSSHKVVKSKGPHLDLDVYALKELQLAFLNFYYEIIF